MAYSLTDPQPDNLQANETALTLDDGTIAAISVNPTWLDNNSGVMFRAVARHINADGSPCLCGNGVPVQTTLTHTALTSDVTELGQDAISAAVLKAVLGEPAPTRVKDGATIPIVGIDGSGAESASIRVAAELAANTGPGNVGSLLGL